MRGGAVRVKLLDFGIAKLARLGDAARRRPRRAASSARPSYIVARAGARQATSTHRTDIYSLGVIAYEMVLGRLPFVGDNPADAIQMHLCAAPPRPSILWQEIPPRLEALLLKLPGQGCPAARATLAEVRATLASLAPTATPALNRVDDAPPPSLLRRRRRVPAGARGAPRGRGRDLPGAGVRRLLAVEAAGAAAARQPARVRR